MKRIICFIFFIIFILSCQRVDKKTTDLSVVKTNVDTSLLLNRIKSAQSKLDSMGLSSESDSIRFYLYTIFYDEKVKATDTSFFSSYDLVPIYIDGTTDSIVIRYNLLKVGKDNKKVFDKITSNFLDVEYRANARRKFNKQGIVILGKVYMKERIAENNANKIIEFLKNNVPDFNEWYWTEINKRRSGW